MPLQSTDTLQGMEGGFWRTDNNFSPILHLKNILTKTGLDVSPAVFFADGTEYALPAIHLEPAGVASVDLRIAIEHAPQALRGHISKYGMVGIAYRWSWPAVAVSIQNTDEIASLSGASSPLAKTGKVHEKPETMAEQVIRGTWWRPTRDSDLVIALGNTSLSVKEVRIRISDKTGSALLEKHVAIETHKTQLIRLSEVVPDNDNPRDAGDLTIIYSGAPHSVVASASIEDETTGYSVTPRLIELNPNLDETVHPVTYDAPGIMLGKPEPSMLFPVDTVFTPYAVLHNLSTRAIATSLYLTSESATGVPVTRPLDNIQISPGAVMVRI